MDIKRRDDARASTLRSAFAGALAARGFDRSIADRCEVEASSFSGMIVTHEAGYSPNGRDFFVVEDDATLPSDISERMEEAVERIRDLTGRRHAILAGCQRIRDTFLEAFGRVGIEPSEIRFASYEVAPSPVVTASVVYRGLDDMLEETDHVLNLQDPVDWSDMATTMSLLVLPQKQGRRRELLGDATPERARRIGGHLARAIRRLEPVEAAEMVSRIDTVVSQGEEFHHIDIGGIIQMRFEDGVLQARIEAGDTVLEHDVLTIKGASLPENVILHLPKRRVREVIDHDLIGDRRIVTATQDEDGVQLTVAPLATAPLSGFLSKIEEAA